MAYDLLGKNFTPPDVHAKVTGKAKYAEDFRVDGMVVRQSADEPHAARARHERRRERCAGDAGRAWRAHGRRGRAAARAARDDPDERAVVRGPSDSRRGGRHRRARERCARANQGHVRGIAVYRRSAAKPVPRRCQCAHERQRGESGRRSSNAQMDGAGFRGRRRRAAPGGRGRHSMVVRRPRRGVRGCEARARRDVRHRGSRPPLDGAAQRARVLAERQVLLARLDAEPELPDSRHRAPLRRRARRPRLRLGILRRRLRLEGRRLSADGDSGADVEENRPARDDARVAPRGVLHGLGARRVPRPRQDRLRGRRPRAGRRPLYSAGERPQHGFQRLRVRGRGRLARLSAAGNAVPRRARAHEYAAARPAARARPESDRHGDRAADRQSGETAWARSRGYSPPQRARQRARRSARCRAA